MFFNEHLLKHLKTNFGGVPHILTNQKKPSLTSQTDFNRLYWFFLNSLRVSRVNLSSNGIAQQLTPEHLHRLEEICFAIDLTAGQVLEPATHGALPVYFLVDAVACVWIEFGTHAPGLAIALTGKEGIAGGSHLWPAPAAPWVSKVLKPGRAFQTTAQQLRVLFDQMPELIEGFSRFLWTQTQEIAQLSARAQRGDIRTRLALWLHLLHKKTESPILQITHQELANMLGTRRVSVTVTAGAFQDEGILTLRRGTIHILNSQALAHAAGLQSI